MPCLVSVYVDGWNGSAQNQEWYPRKDYRMRLTHQNLLIGLAEAVPSVTPRFELFQSYKQDGFYQIFSTASAAVMVG